MSKEVASYPSLNNKIVLITGGASGIGETIVENFFLLPPPPEIH